MTRLDTALVTRLWRTVALHPARSLHTDRLLMTPLPTARIIVRRTHIPQSITMWTHLGNHNTPHIPRVHLPIPPLRPFVSHIAPISRTSSPPAQASLADSEDLDDPDDHVLSDLALSSPLSSSLSARSEHCNLDWDEHLPSAYSSSLCHAFSSGFPFIFDSGASCHISPARADFKTFRPISSQRVTGLGGSFVSAVGCGSVDISMATGHKLTLHNVLYIPSSDVRLVSVHALNFAGNFASHFDTASCWVTDRSGATIARGDILPGRNLYYFPSISTPSISSAAASPSAHLARPVPNVETWHRRLGHCNPRTIIEMARSGVVEGMHIDLSLYKSDHIQE